jgi:hypothetical protein
MAFVTENLVAIQNDRALTLLAYHLAFQAALKTAVARAISPASPIMAAAVSSSLYFPKDITAAAEVAESLGMTAEVGVASLAGVTALALAKGNARTFWGRLMSLKAPRTGTLEYHHLLMYDYALKVLEGVDPMVTRRFAEKFADTLERLVSGESH